MVLNAAVQMLREADELKQKILNFKSGTSMLQERSLWVAQQQLQKIYQKVLVLDLDYALEKKVEQDLWNVGFKQQIEALQSISKDKKNPLRSDGQAMLSWVLQAAAGFYLCLLHQICTTFKLDLPFRRRASLLGWVEGWGASGAGTGAGVGTPPPAAARYICQHCLVHLGDLARYRHHLTVAHSFYRHALVVSVHSGQPYNQLALVAWRRGRRLAALYWHVRSLLVRAPFPPAPANLARTLHAAASGGLAPEGSLPVLPGLDAPAAPSPAAPPTKLDAHTYVTELIRAIHMIHTVDQLETAEVIVNRLNSALPSLIVADAFEAMTLVKMSCVLMWVVEAATEGLGEAAAALSDGEAEAARLAAALAAGALRGALLAAAVANVRAQPALKVWLQWCICRPRLWRGTAWAAAGWAALSRLPRSSPMPAYSKCPLPEDEELHGFLPLERALEGLRFEGHAAWDTYGGRLPPDEDAADEQLCGAGGRLGDEDTQRKVRSGRIVALARQLADLRPDLISYTEDEEGNVQFAAAGEERVAGELAALVAARAPSSDNADNADADACADADSDDEPPPPPPPVVISEADFREKVREKRVGILKPQGSLERAREERALASTQDEQDSDGAEDGSKGEEKKESRKPRVNIAMAAIMRKQEESNKQVKFVSPPPTPETATDTAEKDQEKPKVIQPKAIKSLGNLPLGRKTGGILSLKDKSAGYPHLVNTDTEPAKKADKEEKKEQKPNQISGQNQSHQQKRPEPPVNRIGNQPQPAAYGEGPRTSFQKNYGVQNNPNHTPPVNGQGIRLPVVNPKEIDVRTAALQKQTSRADQFDGNKFHHGYHVSGDKRNFLDDLPPRFANQYRYWQTAQDGQSENKFRDDGFKQNSAPYNATVQQWAGQRPPDNYQQQQQQQQQSWWKPDANFNQTSGFYSPHGGGGNVPNPYRNVPSYNPLQSAVGQQKTENMPSYPPAIGQSLQSLQNMAGSASFASPLNSFGTYAPSVGYDASMYPQFGSNLGYRSPLKAPDPPPFQRNDLMAGFGSGAMDQRNQRNVNFADRLGGDMGAMKSLDMIGGMEGMPGDPAGNTYSLFSGAPDAGPWAAGPHLPQQSLWSGPGPSPLERLLEQQKQMKQPPPPQ